MHYYLSQVTQRTCFDETCGNSEFHPILQTFIGKQNQKQTLTFCEENFGIILIYYLRVIFFFFASFCDQEKNCKISLQKLQPAYCSVDAITKCVIHWWSGTQVDAFLCAHFLFFLQMTRSVESGRKTTSEFKPCSYQKRWDGGCTTWHITGRSSSNLSLDNIYTSGRFMRCRGLLQNITWHREVAM